MITKVQYIDLVKLSIEEGTGGHMNFPGKGYKVDFWFTLDRAGCR